MPAAEPTISWLCGYPFEHFGCNLQLAFRSFASVLLQKSIILFGKRYKMERTVLELSRRYKKPIGKHTELTGNTRQTLRNEPEPLKTIWDLWETFGNHFVSPCRYLYWFEYCRERELVAGAVWRAPPGTWAPLARKCSRRAISRIRKDGFNTLARNLKRVSPDGSNGYLGSPVLEMLQESNFTY